MPLDPTQSRFRKIERHLRKSLAQIRQTAATIDRALKAKKKRPPETISTLQTLRTDCVQLENHTIEVIAKIFDEPPAQWIVAPTSSLPGQPQLDPSVAAAMRTAFDKINARAASNVQTQTDNPPQNR